ncbi:MAG: cyclic nucleotide-binding domain-containing protein [bacterium]|nr:cyclic nucleotide-binding domain-containing protein [bacterium]
MFSKYSNSFLKDFDINKILSGVAVKEFVPFEYPDLICEENSKIGCIFLILSGKVEMKKFYNGRNETFGCMGPGDFIGIEDALTGESYNKSVYALEKTDTISVKKNDFLDFTKYDDKFRLWILKYLSNRISALP